VTLRVVHDVISEEQDVIVTDTTDVFDARGLISERPRYRYYLME